MTSKKITIAGVGNCTSSLNQRIEYYRGEPVENLGLMPRDLGGFGPEDIEIVSAFGMDVRKVNRSLHEAIFARPNSTKKISKDVSNLGVTVRMGPALDEVALPT